MIRSGWLKVPSILARAVPAALSPRAVDRAVPVLVGATLVAFAAGSSSVAQARDAAHDVRWVVLAALLAAAATWAPGVRRLPPAVPLAAAVFVALALASSLWSVAPRLSAGRALSVALLLATAVLLAAGAADSAARGRGVLLGLLGGAAAVAVLGPLVLAVSYGTAVTAASVEAPSRYRGFGEDPNTVPVLLSLTLPVGLVWALRDDRLRWPSAAAVALFAGSIAGSGSRGALFAAAAGSAVAVLFAVREPGRRWAALVAVAAAAAVAGVLQSLPQASSPAPAPAASAPRPNPAPPRYLDAERVFPLDDDVGRPLPAGGEPTVSRSFLGTSGRAEAWRGAIRQAAGRPVLGFGFGTEARVFVDRYHGFFGGLPEDSYIGIALQLGALGLLTLLGLVAVPVAAGARALVSRVQPWSAACAGVVAAGLTIAVVQSYLYSVGNVGTATFWIAAFLLAGFAVAGEAL